MSSLETQPDEVTRVLDIEPSETAKRGERIYPKLLVYHKRNLWMLMPPVDTRTGSLLHQTEILLSKVKPRVQAFSRLPGDVEVKMFCAVYIYERDERPYLGLSNEAMKILSEIGASVEFDLFYVSYDEEEDLEEN